MRHARSSDPPDGLRQYGTELRKSFAVTSSEECSLTSGCCRNLTASRNFPAQVHGTHMESGIRATVGETRLEHPSAPPQLSRSRADCLSEWAKD